MKTDNRTPGAHRKDTFLTMRVTQDFRDALSVVAEQSLRSVSSQAFYYIQLGMYAEAREKALQDRT
jgi:hypothetical protein